MKAKAPPPPKPKSKPRKPKKKKKPKKFFDTMKKKAMVIIMVIGIVIAAVGFAYPSAYWKSQNAYSPQQLSDDQVKTPSLIVYDSWDQGNELSVHGTVQTLKDMIGTVYIEGVTYTEKLSLDNQPRPIGDNYLVYMGEGQYFIITGAQEPDVHEDESILATGQVRMIVGEDANGQEKRMEILFVNKADIEENNMDSVFFLVGVMGAVIGLIGLGVWMFFVFAPMDDEPEYVDLAEKRKEEFMETLSEKKEGKEYPCPVCGINMTYREEFGKWYCDICNKMY